MMIDSQPCTSRPEIAAREDDRILAKKGGRGRWTVIVFVAICRHDQRKSRENLVIESERAHSYRLANGLLLCKSALRSELKSEICRHMVIVLAFDD
jgi:hypothetical protein